MEVVQNLPSQLETGVYYGFASIDNGDVHKMVMSIGWNPFYENKHKSMVRNHAGSTIISFSVNGSLGMLIRNYLLNVNPTCDNDAQLC